MYSLWHNLSGTLTRHQLDIPIILSKDSGSDSEVEAWSFDKAVNEVFRLLLQELFPKLSEEHTPAKPLSGIEQLMACNSIISSSSVKTGGKYYQVYPE